MNGGQPDSTVSQFLRFTDLFSVSPGQCAAVWGVIDKSVQCADNDGASICSGG